MPQRRMAAANAQVGVAQSEFDVLACLVDQGDVRSPSALRERNDDVEIFGFVRRQAHELAAGEEGKLLEQAFFVPDLHFFPELLEHAANRDLAAERVTVGTDVAQHDERLMLAERGGDFRKAGVR